jgi:hypothetical protein
MCLSLNVDSWLQNRREPVFAMRAAEAGPTRLLYPCLLPQSMPGCEANAESLRKTTPYDIEMCAPSRRSPAAYK